MTCSPRTCPMARRIALLERIVLAGEKYQPDWDYIAAEILRGNDEPMRARGRMEEERTKGRLPEQPNETGAEQ